MKKIANQIRLIVRAADRETLMSDVFTLIDEEKQGIYEHKGELYQYLCSNKGCDYFIKTSTWPEVGIVIE